MLIKSHNSQANYTRITATGSQERSTSEAPKGDRVEIGYSPVEHRPVSRMPARTSHNIQKHGPIRALKTAMWCALAAIPFAVACGMQSSTPANNLPTPAPISVVVNPPAPAVTTTTPTGAPTVTNVTIPAPESTNPTTVVTISTPAEVVAPAVRETPPAEVVEVVPPAPEEVAPPAPEVVAPHQWDWHETFSPYDLAEHQLYSNDCGVTAAEAELRAHGYDVDHETLFDDAIAGGFHSGRGGHNGWNGPYKMVDYLGTFGLNARMEAFNRTNVDNELAQGKPIIVSTERHYFVISGQDERGNLIAGATGEVVGMGPVITYNQLSNFGGAHRIIVVDDASQPAEMRAPAYMIG